MNRMLYLGAALALVGLVNVAQAGHRGGGCGCGGGYSYAQPAYPAVQPAAPAAPVAPATAQANSGYRSYSYEPTQAAAPAAAYAAPAAAYSSPGTIPSSYYGGQNYSYYGAYNRPASSRGWNGAAWKVR